MSNKFRRCFPGICAVFFLPAVLSAGGGQLSQKKSVEQAAPVDLVFKKSSEFINPPAECRIHPMNHEFTNPGTIKSWTAEMRQAMNPDVVVGSVPKAGAFVPLDKLVASGAGGTVLNVAWTERWIEDPLNISNLGAAARLVKANGLRAWLYDEYFYPSGWGKGLSVKGHPENRARNIAYIFRSGSDRQTISLPLPPDGVRFDYAAFYPAGSIDGEKAVSVPVADELFTTQSPDDKWDLYVFYVKKHNVSHFQSKAFETLPGGGRGYLNFLNRSAVGRYLDVTLQPLADRISDFDGLFDGLFVDEPSLMCFYYRTNRGVPGFDSVPWGDELYTEFSRLHGYDLQPFLPSLFRGDSEISRTVRLQYYRTVASLMERNFTGQVAAWCRNNGIASSGHFLLEEYLYAHVGYYGDLMKVIKEMDWPGCDILASTPELYYKRAEYMGTRFVSSAARGSGRARVMAEICPVHHDKNDTFRKNPFEGFMALVTHASFHGVTHFNMYGYHFIQDSAQQRRLNDYTGRICRLLRESVSDASVAVYVPIADTQAAMRPEPGQMPSLNPEAVEIDTQFKILSRVLLDNQRDFNFITEEMVLGADVIDGRLAIAAQSYRAVVLPDIHVIPLDVLEKLRDFKEAGGIVLSTGCRPDMGVSMDEHIAVRCLANSLETPLSLNSLLERLNREMPDRLVVDSLQQGQLFVSRRRLDDRPLYYMINSQSNEAFFTCDDRQSGRAVLFDFETGRVEEISLPAELKLSPHRGLALLLSDK